MRFQRKVSEMTCSQFNVRMRLVRNRYGQQGIPHEAGASATWWRDSNGAGANERRDLIIALPAAVTGRKR